MAKRKYPTLNAIIEPYTPPKMPDNNPEGPYPLPDWDLNGCESSKKMSFVDMVAKGESVNAPDVIVQTANGISRTMDEGMNQQYNWGDGTSGEWTNNRNWKGGNLSGE